MRTFNFVGVPKYTQGQQQMGLNLFPTIKQFSFGCSSCQYGKLTKKHWQSKGQQSTLWTVMRLGQVDSVDQLESNTNGFITQLKGI